MIWGRGGGGATTSMGQTFLQYKWLPEHDCSTQLCSRTLAGMACANRYGWPVTYCHTTSHTCHVPAMAVLQQPYWQLLSMAVHDAAAWVCMQIIKPAAVAAPAV